MPLTPVAIYGLAVPPGDEPIEAISENEFPCTFRITMAAIDPSAEPETEGIANGAATHPRATLKMIRLPTEDDDDESDDDEDEDDEDLNMADLLDDDSDEEADDEELNGGPSDPSKSPKALKRKALLEAIVDAEKEMDGDSKGKSKKISLKDEDDDDLDDEDDDDDDDEDILEGAEEFVICTLDPTKNYQQTLDITISEHERVLFSVSGTHAVYLTGNVLYEDEQRDHPDLYDSDSDSEGDYDLAPGDELDDIDMEVDDYEDEDDELDDIKDPRITELDDDEPAPKLIPAKGKNKRAADDSADSTPVKAGAAAAVNGDAALTKSQKKKLAKKLKDNAGLAVEPAAAATKKDAVELAKASPKDKKVQFAESIVQGPTGSAAKEKEAAAAAAGKAALGKKKVNGVEIDDKKLGSGPQAKAGDRISMRYIGKLDKDKKVFDSNKKGAPFTFRLGKGEVIRGWDVGIAGMQAGGERRITIPADLAYGKKGAPPQIPPNAALVFDVKCLEIKK